MNLRLALWNANGISNHVREVELFLKDNYIDVMLVSETHFTNRSYIKIKEYDFISTNHPDNRAHAGSGILIKSTIKYKIVECIQKPFLQATNIKLVCNDGDLVLSSIYFPPRHNVTCPEYENFFKSLGTKFLVGGDFNAKHPWWGSRLANPKGRELYKCLTKNSYNKLSTGSPTYWPSDPSKIPDLLDFVIYNGIPSRSLRIKSSDELSSDHSPILVTINISHELKVPKYNLLKPNTDIDCFQDYMDNNINLNVRLKTEQELDEAVEKFTCLIHTAAHMSTPVQEDLPQAGESGFYVSTETRRLLREKRNLRKTWQRNRNPRTKQLLNKATKDLREMLNDCHNDLIGENIERINSSQYDEYLLWKATKYIKRPTKRKTIIKNSDGTWCRSNENTSETFAMHLKETFTPFPLNTVDDQNEVREYLNCPLQMSLPIKHISPNEVIMEIKSLPKGKSPGFDLIDAKVVKSLSRKSIIFLTLLYNSILRLNHFPTQWKCAEIIMIHKHNKPENLVSSYRPISLLAIFSKIFERLLLSRLLPVLETENIIPEHQFGFRPKHGTPEQVHRIVQYITDAFEKKKYCSAAFLDIQQAFDRVWHNGLLYKIKRYLPAPYYLFFKSYLADRFFYVRVDDENSDLYEINAGIPQGSVLGPLLYTLYTSDLPTSDNVLMATYADDTAIIASSDFSTTASALVQAELNKLDQWLKKWNVRVNPDKSKHITFALRRENCPSLQMNSTTIPASDTVNYLGIILDRRLTWKQHLKSKRQQLKIKTRKLHWLIGPRSKLNLNNKLRIYKCILKPVWTYGIQLWGTACRSNVDIIERYQSKTLRLITGAPWYMRNICILKDLLMPSVREEITRFSERYLERLSDHVNPLAISLLDCSDEARRLKRHHILDLPFRN